MIKAIVPAHPRQIVLFLDGTGNTLTAAYEDTNVSRLFVHVKSLKDSRQLTYYNSGAGAPTAMHRGAGALQSLISRLPGLALGEGVVKNISEAYLFVARKYILDDQIFIFGFSRGALTGACVAGLIDTFGLISEEHEVLMPRLLGLYLSSVTKPEEAEQHARVISQMRSVLTNDAGQLARVHFLGLWDAVASVGAAPFSLFKSPPLPRTIGGKIDHVRHAIALDEYRRQYSPQLFQEHNHGTAQDGHSLVQIWFPGAHCDVGGGYRAPESGLSRQTLRWMAGEASECGLRLSGVPEILGADGIPVADPKRVAHDELHSNSIWAFLGMRKRSPPPGAVIAAQPQFQMPQWWIWSRRRSFVTLLLLLGTSQALGLALHYQLLGDWKVPLLRSASMTFVALVLELEALFDLTVIEEFRSRFRDANVPLLVACGVAYALLYGAFLSRLLTWSFARVARLQGAARLQRVLSVVGAALPAFLILEPLRALLAGIALSTESALLGGLALSAAGVIVVLLPIPLLLCIVLWLVGIATTALPRSE